MTNLEQHILDRVRDRLNADRLDNAIVYLDYDVKRAGDQLTFTDVIIHMPWDGYIAFVDLEPKANWGHACCYLAIRLSDDEVIVSAASMPPFLKAETSTFKLLWRGPLTPAWAVTGSSE